MSAFVDGTDGEEQRRKKDPSEDVFAVNPEQETAMCVSCNCLLEDPSQFALLPCFHSFCVDCAEAEDEDEEL